MQTNQKTFSRKIVSVAMSALMIMSMIPAALASNTGKITNIQDNGTIYEGAQITMTATGANNVNNHIDWAVEGYNEGDTLPEGLATISKHKGILTAVSSGWIKVTAYLSDGAKPGQGQGGGNGNLCPGATVLDSVILEIQDAVEYGYQGDGQNSMKVVSPAGIQVTSTTTENNLKKFNNTINGTVPLTNGTANFVYMLSAGGNQNWTQDYLDLYHKEQMQLVQINKQTNEETPMVGCIAVAFNNQTHQFTAQLSSLTPGARYRLTVNEGMQSMSRGGQQGGKSINCRIEFIFDT